MEALRASLRRAYRRLQEWTTEMPSIVAGLYYLCKPLRRAAFIIFLMNATIAVWETVQPLIFKWGIDQIPHSSMLEMVIIIVVPLFVLAAPHGIILPFVREVYSARYFRPLFERHVSLMCLKRSARANRPSDSEISDQEAPIAQEGRLATLGLIEQLLRDPAFAMRGLILLGILGYTSPVLLSIVTIGMTADLLVTLFMDDALMRPYAKQKEAMFQVREAEFKAYDQEHHSRADAVLHCEKEWEHYVKATQYAETWRLIYQLPIRETISFLWRGAVMILVGSWVVAGTATIGDYYWLVQLAGRASDPLVVILGLQQAMMMGRESLRRLGILAKVNFGITSPH